MHLLWKGWKFGVFQPTPQPVGRRSRSCQSPLGIKFLIGAVFWRPVPRGPVAGSRKGVPDAAVQNRNPAGTWDGDLGQRQVLPQGPPVPLPR